MAFEFKASFSPKFNVKEIVHQTIEKQWIEFQFRAFELGETMLSYMQTYIASQIKGDTSSGNLVRSIKLYNEAGAGEAKVAWGIGLMTEMNVLAPYWKLINYGGVTWKGDYHFVPGHFEGNKFVYVPNSKDGEMLPSGVKTVIKGMNYIESTRMELDREINKILKQLSVSK